MNRRALLSGLAVGPIGAVAGCFGGGCTASTTVSFEPVDAETIATDLTADFDMATPAMTALADRVLAGETPTIETMYDDPLGWLTYVEYDGGFYEIADELVAEGQISGPEYELTYESDDEALAADAIAFTDLPRHDQWRVSEGTFYHISADGIDSYRSTNPFVAGYLDEADQDESTLAAGIDASAIEAGGDLVSIEHLGEGSAHAHRYRYTATRVADDVDGFADHVFTRYGSTAFDPSDEARWLLSETRAEGGRLRVCERGSTEVDEETNERRQAAVDDLRREVRSLTPRVVPDGEDPPRVRYVRYEGQWYRIGFMSSVV